MPSGVVACRGWKAVTELAGALMCVVLGGVPPTAFGRKRQVRFRVTEDCRGRSFRRASTADCEAKQSLAAGSQVPPDGA